MIGSVILVQDPNNPMHRMLCRVVAASLSHGTANLVVCDDHDTAGSTITTANSTMTLSDYASTMNAICYKEEPPPEPYINGDLRYLYRPPITTKRLPIRRNHRLPLRQPCWRAGRWKSLT